MTWHKFKDGSETAVPEGTKFTLRASQSYFWVRPKEKLFCNFLHILKHSKYNKVKQSH